MNYQNSLMLRAFVFTVVLFFRLTAFAGTGLCMDLVRESSRIGEAPGRGPLPLGVTPTLGKYLARMSKDLSPMERKRFYETLADREKTDGAILYSSPGGILFSFQDGALAMKLMLS